MCGYVAWLLDQTSSNWIHYYVPNHEDNFLVVTNDSLKPITLPESTSSDLAEVISGVLLRCSDECIAVRVLVETTSQDVHVVRHETVRSQFKAAFPASSRELREGQVDHLRVGQCRLTSIGAEREEIVMLPGIWHLGMTGRVRMGHVDIRAEFVPLVLPAKAGSHRTHSSLPALAGRFRRPRKGRGFSRVTIAHA